MHLDGLVLALADGGRRTLQEDLAQHTVVPETRKIGHLKPVHAMKRSRNGVNTPLLMFLIVLPTHWMMVPRRASGAMSTT